MKFIALWNLKEGVDQARMAEMMGRRAELKFPPGMSLIAEYWSSKGSPAAISVFEASDAAALMINSVVWIDVFNVDIFPVVTFEEGLDKLTKYLSGG